MDFQIIPEMEQMFSMAVSGGVFNYGISEFLGCFFFLPILPFLIFSVMDGLGIFRDQFMTSNRRPR